MLKLDIERCWSFKDIKFFFLSYSIINKTWKDYQKHYPTIPFRESPKNFAKSYLRDGRMTKDTDGYLVT